MQAANDSYDLIRGAILLLLAVGIGGWLIFRALKRSEEPSRLLFKIIFTAVIGAFMIFVVFPLVARGGFNAIHGLSLALICGLTLAITWRHELAGLIARPFSNLYDGGDVEVTPAPFYSMAEARRKKGQYTEAVAEIRKQLAKFPNDFEGHMLLAEIQAVNQNDLPGAELTIQRLCAQPGHAPRHLAYAFSTLADWHLKITQDRDAARQDLEKVIELMPGTEFALAAEQRIAHLASPDHLLAPHSRQIIHVPAGVKNVGLLSSSGHLAPTATDPAQVAAEFVAHLEQHPQDTEAREKLAVIYADHYQRLDLAADQLNQLIEQPNQPAKLVVNWLNLLADLQVRHDAGYDAAAQTLGRIIERYPDAAAAGLARNRLDLLKLELKAREKSTAIKMGTYEQNIGLKRSGA